ncbi:hypothetical protein K503DRAFT_678620 [Rhizopogon vinicolor AM-OR11-026]|uniref:Uncharacterized protein n=1 Tax=Rhizopogon vinicolor AM-OR11-026 TaxID=1314800 RepID=A0A1B7NI45_9AGAM|nr:hypothetical protein K503DRAFT_678620 [Rhizopogon vinicolor AM-OR11-026]
MDLPTLRELDLETELRKRDAQVAELTDEVTRLRQHLAVQNSVSTTDPVTLPPALVSVLLPHINNATSSKGAEATSSSSTVNTALTQRTRILQEENDELYELLKSGETGKLKEEVRGLRRVVERLEGALRESHQVIASLSSELDKSYDSFQASLRQMNASHHYAPPSRESYHPTTTTNGVTKLPPTGPRAHKKPRLEPKVSPAHSNISLPPSKPQTVNARQSIPRDHEPPRSPRLSPADLRTKPGNVKMEVDEDSRTRPRSPNDNRDRESHRRDKDRGRERDKERDRDRDRDRFSRRNGGSGGGGRKSRGFSGHAYAFGDRTLAERMGL